MTSIIKCRRRTDRYELPEGVEAILEFGYPGPDDHRCSMPIKDFSAAGLSFVLTHELPGLDLGTSLEEVTVRAGDRSFRADLIVMHLTPDTSPGSVCGAVLYTESDEDAQAIEQLFAELQQRAAASSSD